MYCKQHLTIIFTLLLICSIIPTYFIYISSSCLEQRENQNFLAPKLRSSVSQINQTIGSLFQIICVIGEGSFPVYFHWLKNSEQIKSEPDNNYRILYIESTETLSMLTIIKISLSDVGNYTCVANNLFGTHSRNVFLNIKDRPYLSRRLRSSNGDNITNTTQTSTEASNSSSKVTDPVTTDRTEELSKKVSTTKLLNTQKTSTEMTTTLTSLSTTTEAVQFSMSMTITIDGEYDLIVGVDKQMFLDNVKKQLATYLRLPLSCIVNMDSRPGSKLSINVIFELVASVDPNFPINQEGLIAAKHEFELKIRANKVYITDSLGEKNRVLSSIDNNPDNSGQGDENGTSSNQMSYLIMGLVVGAVVLMIVLIIITACAVRSYMYRKFMRQIRPRAESAETMNDIPSRDGIPSVNTMRLMTGMSREGLSSSGLYFYDSGVWDGGAVPEPNITESPREVPERPFYLPPNHTKIAISPKSPPRVINQLKSDGTAIKGQTSVKRQTTVDW